MIIDIYWEVKQKQNKQQKHKYDVTALNFEVGVSDYCLIGFMRSRGNFLDLKLD